MNWIKFLVLRSRLRSMAALLFLVLASGQTSAVTGVVVHIPHSVTMFSNPLYQTYTSTQNLVNMSPVLREKVKQSFWKGWTGKAVGGAVGGCFVGTVTGGAALASGVWENRLIAGRLLAGCAGGVAAGMLGQTAAVALAALSAPTWVVSAGGLIVTGTVGVGVVAAYDHLFNVKDPGTRKLLTVARVMSHGRATALPGSSYEARYRAYFQKELAWSHSYGVDWTNSDSGDYCFIAGNCFFKDEGDYVTRAHLMW